MAIMVLSAINVYGNNLDAAADIAGYDEVLVTGGSRAIRTLPGSASFIDQQAIEAFDSCNINSLLGQVPGVNLRLEDGYGLRPNMGIR